MDNLQKRVFALLREAKVSDRQHRMGLASWILFREVTTFKDLSRLEYQTIGDVLTVWQGRCVLVEEDVQRGVV